jgi:4-diphosphocytidyl-2-C-methyl-D-erythritol kinase
MSQPLRQPLFENAPAKINLSLRVLGKRRDGYHALCSLVTFASIADRLSLKPAQEVSLTVSGSMAAQLKAQTSNVEENLILKAHAALSTRIANLRSGQFHLTKVLPLGAGIGGGSADAAASLRLLARLNGLSPSDPRVKDAALELGSDVPVCLNPATRLMQGRGEVLSAPLPMPAFHGVLISPMVHVSTPAVFRTLGAPEMISEDIERALSSFTLPPQSSDPETWLKWLKDQPNDLTAPACHLAPDITGVMDALSYLEGAELVRMSGSGSTVFGIFESCAKALSATSCLRTNHPAWWVKKVVIGSVPETL